MHTHRLTRGILTVIILAGLAVGPVACGAAGSGPGVASHPADTPRPPPAPSLTGQDIGQAEKATRAVLDRLLAETGTSFNGWVILNDLGAAHPTSKQNDLVGRIAGGLKIDEQPVRDALAELARQDLIKPAPAAAANPEVTITPAGATRFHQLQEAIKQITQRLYGNLPAEDLATAHRVLTTVTERANAELTR